MWQTVTAVVIVALAAAWVGRRLYRSLRGRGPACCGGDAPDSGGPCAGCAPAPPQNLESLAPPQGRPHCQTNPRTGGGQGPAKPDADES